MSRVKAAAGDFFAIPLSYGGYGYARKLDKLVSFYDLRTDQENPVCPVELENKKVLFTTTVHVSAFRKSSGWLKIGNMPLSPDFRRDVRFFRKNPSGRGFLIYVSKSDPVSAYDEYPASAKECEGLEPLLVWEAEHIQSRLEEHFFGKQNEYVARALADLESKLSVN